MDAFIPCLSSAAVVWTPSFNVTALSGSLRWHRTSRTTRLATRRRPQRSVAASSPRAQWGIWRRQRFFARRLRGRGQDGGGWAGREAEPVEEGPQPVCRLSRLCGLVVRERVGSMSWWVRPCRFLDVFSFFSSYRPPAYLVDHGPLTIVLVACKPTSTHVSTPHRWGGAVQAQGWARHHTPVQRGPRRRDW